METEKKLLDEATRGKKGKKGLSIGGKQKKKGTASAITALSDQVASKEDHNSGTGTNTENKVNGKIDEEDEKDKAILELEQEVDDGWESGELFCILAIQYDLIPNKDLNIDNIEKARKKPIIDPYVNACRVLGIVPVSFFVEKVKQGDREIILKHRGLGPKGAQAIAAVLETNTSITHLDLSDNWIEQGGATLGRSLQINRALVNLDLSNNKLSLQSGAEIAEMLAFNGTLKTLNLKGNSFGDKEATLLAEGLKQNSSLEAIDLSYNHIGDLGANALGAGLIANDSLRELNMAWNEIRVRGATGFLNYLKDNSHITLLNLQDNGIGESGQPVSLFLAKSNSINILNVSRTRMNDASMILVAKGVEQNYSIKELDVSENPVGDLGMLALFKSILSSNCIKRVILKHIKITKEARVKLEELKNEKPEVEIVE
ncbi:UNVERIFIED_CONTAM: hypothetical protein HDU68_009687 [Siphonaria sp. JEL0065]|nr:hypothetical protein HDU68_009687 [Siphonaria sp. JEL0065]